MADKYVNATGLRAVIDWILSAFTKKKDFDALEIGGRNLLLYSEDLTKWDKEDGVSVVKDSDGWFKVVDSLHTVHRWGIYFDILEYEQNTDYTISVDTKYGDTKIGVGYGFDDVGSVYKEIDSGSKRIKITFNTGSNTKMIKVYLFIRKTSANQYGYFKLPKLEKGNKATDWTPAPEDVETAISDVTNDCIKGLSVSDKTITYTKGDGSKGTITTQDTNTWRGIQNNLTSDSTTDSLAAAQGKALKALVDGKAASSHKHAKSDITDMPTSLPANGGNADTVDGKHATDIFNHIGLQTCGQVDANIRGCFNVNLTEASIGWLNVVQFEQGHFITQLGFSVGEPCSVFVRTRYAANSFTDWNTGWTNLGTNIVIGTSTGTIAYKSGYTKALIEFWKTTAGSASRTVYDAALITGLSSSMTAVTPSAISSGQDFAFALGNDASGGIIISGNFTKYKITYFN